MSDDINNYRQNHPELICRDLGKYIDRSVVRKALKYRGVNKWLRVRRLLIQLKLKWKEQLNKLEAKRLEAKRNKEWLMVAELKGRKEQLADCRQQVRALCHSPRDVDFPEGVGDFGDICVLPYNFPNRPHKRWFWAAEVDRQKGIGGKWYGTPDGYCFVLHGDKRFCAEVLEVDNCWMVKIRELGWLQVTGDSRHPYLVKKFCVEGTTWQTSEMAKASVEDFNRLNTRINNKAEAWQLYIVGNS